MDHFLDISRQQLYLFNNGLDYESFNIFGAHLYTYNGVNGVRFLVYAPNAVSVSVVGDFNNWDINANIMIKDNETGAWYLFIAGLKEFDIYKYAIRTKNNEVIFKADPYAFYSEVRPNTASKIYNLDGYKWTDDSYIKKRNKTDHFQMPKNIYEVHLGSFMQNKTEKQRENILDIPVEAFMNYRELADKMIPYVKSMNYTHIEIMPLTEHPFDGSWGYQSTGYFSLTSRYGEPKDFMYFVDMCHKNNIAVIIDWVPGHFCKDAHGLYKFDGDYLYDGKEHKHWGTMTFNMKKKEVWSFLFSSAVFFIEKFHVDGIRFDGVSSMLYLNYGVENESEKVFNKYGDEGDLDAIEFLQELNKLIGEKFPGIMTIAEESTAWPNVTKPKDIGGLCFHYKWDMGWMNDTLNYMKTDFPYRTKDHDRLTFSMMYANAENYILPLSHDEVVHGKCSLINKMPGDYDEKFAGLKNLLTYQMTRPSAKLNFMGGEFAQFNEWKYFERLDWNLLDYEKHRKHQDFIRELNRLYIEEKAFYELDYHIWDSFQWIDANNRNQNIYIYERKGSKESDRIIVILNFSKQSYEKFRIGSSLNGIYEEILNSNDEKWGGTNDHLNNGKITTDEIPYHDKEFSLEINIPKLSSVVLKLTKQIKIVKKIKEEKNDSNKSRI